MLVVDLNEIDVTYIQLRILSKTKKETSNITKYYNNKKDSNIHCN